MLRYNDAFRHAQKIVVNSSKKISPAIKLLVFLLTLGLVTAFKNHSLCGVYVNYVDYDWNIKSRLLDAVDTSTAKPSMAHTRQIAEILVDNDLHHRFSFVTADNGPDLKPSDLRRNMHQFCRERGYIHDEIRVPGYQHIPCVGHVIQLVVKDIASVIMSVDRVHCESIESIRECVAQMSSQLSDDDEDWFDTHILGKRLSFATAVMNAFTNVRIYLLLLDRCSILIFWKIASQNLHCLYSVPVQQKEIGRNSKDNRG